MFKRFSHRVAALGGAAVITLSVLFALDQLATRQPAAGALARSALVSQQLPAEMCPVSTPSLTKAPHRGAFGMDRAGAGFRPAPVSSAFPVPA